MATSPVLHDMIKPLSWLLGKWKSTEAKGYYPTIKDFKYTDEIEFFHVGQPNIQFNFYSNHAETKQPLHREIGFLRITPDGSRVSLISAQNIGLTDIEEGDYDKTKQELRLESQQQLGRISFAKPPVTKKIVRYLRRHGDTLEQKVEMETENTPLTEHLSVTYEKVA